MMVSSRSTKVKEATLSQRLHCCLRRHCQIALQRSAELESELSRSAQAAVESNRTSHVELSPRLPEQDLCVWLEASALISIETEGQGSDTYTLMQQLSLMHRFDSVDHAAHVVTVATGATDLIAGSATNDAEIIVTNGSAKLTRLRTLRPARETQSCRPRIR
jgi:hypothetical protein